jgi:tetratricopeptide (TPR) repeat protein
MTTNKKLTLMTIALLCIALGGTSWAQKKKSADAEAMATAAQAMELVKQGAYPQAIEAFTKAIEGSPKDSRLYVDRGGVYLSGLQKFTEAAADFTKAVELAPKDYNGYSLRGAALIELNQVDAALVDLNKALELKPDEPRTLERRGYAFYKQKNYEAALADYNKALELNPTATLALSRRADAYVAMEQLAPAQADLQAYLKIRPEDFNAEERLRYVNAKLNPPAPTAAAPMATPKPPPMKLLTRTNVFIAIGVLLLLGIIVALIAKKAITRSE